jgi:hypothetical protein
MIPHLDGFELGCAEMGQFHADLAWVIRRPVGGKALVDQDLLAHIPPSWGG